MAGVSSREAEALLAQGKVGNVIGRMCAFGGLVSVRGRVALWFRSETRIVETVQLFAERTRDVQVGNIVWQMYWFWSKGSFDLGKMNGSSASTPRGCQISINTYVGTSSILFYPMKFLRGGIRI